jgi:hypothetical protein
MADVFRVLLQFAGAEKSREFASVELSFRGKPKFLISGQYFKQLGQEYGTQNPVYTLRTFPENLMKLDGSRAYPSWTGGLIGVAGRQIEESNNFHRQWWLDDFTAESTRGRTDSKTNSAASPETPRVPSEPQFVTLAAPAFSSRPSDPSSVPMQLPAWIRVFPESQDQVTKTTIGAADVFYTSPAKSDAIIRFYREALAKDGIAIRSAFNGIGTTLQASLANESCIIVVSDADAGATVSVKCAGGQDGPLAQAATPPPPPPLPHGVHRVEYLIRSTGGLTAGLTYRNATGGTEQNDREQYELPASLTFYAASGQFVYISAQNKTDHGAVQVSISVDGKLLQQATSSSAYGIATASGSVPR